MKIGIENFALLCVNKKLIKTRAELIEALIMNSDDNMEYSDDDDMEDEMDYYGKF